MPTLIGTLQVEAGGTAESVTGGGGADAEVRDESSGLGVPRDKMSAAS